MRLLIAITVTLFVGAFGRADPPSARGTPPPALSRTLKTFDFEEREQGNVEETPLGWKKVEGPGLPHYLTGVFDEGVSASGRTSFRFDLNGGSVTYRYPAGRLPTMQHAAYRVSVMCRTTALRFARARLTAYFCDADGRPIPETVRATEPFVSDLGDESFHPLVLDLTADEPAASSIVVELALLQPALLPDKLGSQKLPVEDIRGSAWFDDVRVAQVPDVVIRTDKPANVFHADEPTNIRVQLRDRIATDLTGELRLFDADGKPVFQRTGAIDFSDGDPARGQRLLGTIALPSLGPGWYEARLTIRSNDQFVGEHTIRFVRLGAGLGPTRADARFGLIATGLSPDVWPILPTIVDELAAGRVKLSAWSEKYAVETSVASGFDRLLDTLRRRDVTVTAVLSALPPEVRRTVGGDRWTDLLRVPSDRWQPQLAGLIARHATHLTRWQLMDDDEAEQFATVPAFREAFERVQEEYRQLIGSPDLAMPWPAWFDLDARAPARVALNVPSEVLPEQLPIYINDVKARSTRSVSLTLQPIDRARYGREPQMRDLALRVGYALAGGAESIDLPLPMAMTLRKDGGEPMAEPDKLFVAQRVITATLSGARYAGKVTIAPGIDAFLFDRGGGSGVMLVWGKSHSPDVPVQRVSITLGKQATLIDLYGNTRPLARVGTPDRRRPDDFDLPVGPLPVFVDNVDASLMLLRASIALDNPMLESTSRSVGRRLSFKNTFDAPISGTIRLAGPTGWQVQTGGTSFSLNPGETYDAPVTIEFPQNSSAGDKTLVADVSVQGREDYRIAVPVAAKLGLSDVGLQTIALRSGNEIVVQQMITNYGNAPINYTAFLTAPGQARQERLVSNLGPGRTTIRKYRLAAPSVPGTVAKLRSGVKELEGRRMLNEDVEVQ